MYIKHLTDNYSILFLTIHCLYIYEQNNEKTQHFTHFFKLQPFSTLVITSCQPCQGGTIGSINSCMQQHGAYLVDMPTSTLQLNCCNCASRGRDDRTCSSILLLLPHKHKTCTFLTSVTPRDSFWSVICAYFVFKVHK